MKRCTTCGTTKPLDAFYKARDMRDGRKSSCRKCECEKARQRRKENPEAHRAAVRRWQKANPEWVRERDRRIYWANRERASEYHRQYHAANREARAAYHRIWYEANREAESERTRLWRQANPDKVRATDQRKRARRRNAITDEYASAYMETLRLDPCSYCGADGGTTDHIVPLVLGGDNTADNLTASCFSCNSSKNDTPLLVWLARRQPA